jgi:hypothetical protein
MKIISLSCNYAGPACAVGHCIKHLYYNGNYQTNMFDYLEISMETIINILSTNDINNDLKTNYRIELNNKNKNTVYFNNFNKMVSYHDLPQPYDNNDINNLIEKYQRRYYRLIYDIKREDKIFFIRYGLEDNNNIKKFIDRINQLNPNLKVHFINVDYNDNIDYNDKINYNNKINNDINNNADNDYYHYINFYKFLDIHKKYEEDLYFKTIQFNWSAVFGLIHLLNK